MHVEIKDLTSFVETFLYFFSMGSNAEFTSLDKDLFFLLHERLYEANIDINEEVGGHSSVWAIRAQHENCKAYIVPQPSEYYNESLRRMDLYNGENLILPTEHMEVPT